MAYAAEGSWGEWRADVKRASVLGFALGLMYLAVLPPGNFSVDGTSMIAVAESVVTRGTFTVPPELGKPGVDGQYYSAWYPLASVLAIPFVAAGLAIGDKLGLPAHYLAIICALLLPALLTAATSSLVFLLSLRLGASGRAALLAAIAYALGTIALVYARTFFAEPLLAFLVTGAVYCATGRTKTEIVTGSVLAGLAVLAKPTGLILAPLLCGYLLMKKRPVFVAVLPVLAASAGALLYMTYNILRFESPLSFGQPWAFSMATVPEGLAGLLVSPGRGLLWYSPVALLGLAGIARLWQHISRRPEAVLLALTFAAFLLVHAAWEQWGGGRAWGPRFLLPTLPLLLACAAVINQRWRRLLVILAVAGFVINAPTLITFYERYELGAGRQGISARELHWSLAHAPFLRLWPVAYEQVHQARQMDVRVLVKQAGAPEEQGQLLRVVALWWWMLPVARLPRWPGLVATIVAGGLSLLIMYRLHWNGSQAPSGARAMAGSPVP